MARFYTSATNSRGNTTTAQGLKTGQTVHTRGWNLGVQVISRVDEHDRDVFDIYRTGGSNAAGAPRLIGRVVADTFVPANEL